MLGNFGNSLNNRARLADGRGMRIFALLALWFLSHGPSVADLDGERVALRTFLDALAVVESGQRDDATGDGGRAIGRLQLWRAYWSDAIEHAPDIGGSYDDCRTAEYAERVAVAYWRRYCPKALAARDYEILARVHNGGPRGHKNKATQAYWRKVDREMSKKK